MDLQDRRTRFVRCLEYIRAYYLGPNALISTPLRVKKFSSFHFGAQNHSWRTELVSPFVLREALYATLYAFIHTAQGLCMSAYHDPCCTPKRTPGVFLCRLKEI